MWHSYTFERRPCRGKDHTHLTWSADVVTFLRDEIEEQPLGVRESRIELVECKRGSDFMTSVGGRWRKRKTQRNGGRENWATCGSGREEGGLFLFVFI